MKLAMLRRHMGKQVSIARARDHLPRIVHDVESGSPIELTRRGEPVAVIISVQEYRRLAAGRLGFRDVLDRFRRSVDPGDLDERPETFEGLRDRSPGRELTSSPRSL